MNFKLSEVAAYDSVGLTEAMPATWPKDATTEGEEVLAIVDIHRQCAHLLTDTGDPNESRGVDHQVYASRHLAVPNETFAQDASIELWR